MAELSITHFAGRVGDHNDRGMTGSALVARALSHALGLEAVRVGSPQPALSLGWEEELAAAMPELESLSVRMDDILSRRSIPVTALGRCAAALATLPVVARHRPDAVVVWFDAHADINTPQTSTTGYLGGLALSGPLGLWDSGLGGGLAAANAVLVGTRDIDPAEQELIDSGAVALVAPGADLAERLAAVVGGRPVYVHIDCDVLEPDIVPTDYHVPLGLDLDDLRAAATALAASEVVGLEIGELEADDSHGIELVSPLLHALAPLLTA